MMMMVLKTSMPSVEETEETDGMLLENPMARLGVVIAVCAFVLNSMEAMLYSWKVRKTLHWWVVVVGFFFF